MSAEEEAIQEKPFAVEISKNARAACKKCKQKCSQGELRLAKVGPNPFGSGTMKSWHHVHCLFEQFLKQRETTARIKGPEDVDGFSQLKDEDMKSLLCKIKESNAFFHEKFGVSPPKSVTSPSEKKNTTVKPTVNSSSGSGSSKAKEEHDPSQSSTSGDNSFSEFRNLVLSITNVSSYLEKTKLVRTLFTKGSDGKGFKGDIILWCKLLLPGVVKRVYNLQSKQLIKLFSRLLNCDHDDMLKDLEKGDVAETIYDFFIRSTIKPCRESILSLQEVDNFLRILSTLTKEDDQVDHFSTILKKCTPDDLKIIIRLIKHDLRMNAGAKHILDGVHPDAYEAYQSSRDIDSVVKRCATSNNTVKQSNSVKASVSLMTPVLPMLAEACKSVEQAMKKCSNGMFSEIKYDGERVQVHKSGNEFKFFSRSLKPVLPHKVAHLQEYISRAFPLGEDLILDSEILMMDTSTGKPLPFGTLGIHKKSEFKDACVCLFVFDCIYYNGETLTDKPIKHRKKILEKVMTEIPNHIVFSEYEVINQPKDLSAMIAKVLKEGLEGLVLKDVNSIYEPGKRHWLKVKKDYLFEGAMADSADLIVLGAWYGTGKKGGMMSVFLMGCYDERRSKFCTVTKVHTGHDDKTLKLLQTELKMVKISGDLNKKPNWLLCTKTMIPDFVADNPEQQPIWEITGAEFTKHDVHTADGISIRFPRVTKIRNDKTWDTATSLEELRHLYKTSREFVDLSLLTVEKQDETQHESESSDSAVKNLKRKCDVSKNSSDPTHSPGKRAKHSFVEYPIPDYFSDINLCTQQFTKESSLKWIRYFVAYGGVVLSPENKKQVTHVLHSNFVVKNITNEYSKSVVHVTVQWIKDSISKQKLLDVKPYLVTWRGSDKIVNNIL